MPPPLKTARRERLTRPERRARLIAVADEIVRAVGVEGLTISALAEAAGVARPVVYSHFPKRQDIAIALINHYYENTRALGVAKTQNARTVEEYIAIVVDGGLIYAEKYGEIIDRIAGGFVGDPYIQAALIRYEAVIADFWSAFLRDQGASKEVAEVASHLFQGMIRKGQTLFRVNPRRKRAVRELLVKLVLNAVETLCPDSPEFKPTVRSRPYIAPDAPPQAER
jgi:AcrR family transcriptional regulator